MAIIGSVKSAGIFKSIFVSIIAADINLFILCIPYHEEVE